MATLWISLYSARTRTTWKLAGGRCPPGEARALGHTVDSANLTRGEIDPATHAGRAREGSGSGRSACWARRGERTLACPSRDRFPRRITRARVEYSRCAPAVATRVAVPVRNRHPDHLAAFTCCANGVFQRQAAKL